METKNNNPIDFINNESPNVIIQQYYQINHLKQLYRQGWLYRNVPKEKCESVAEHTFGVVILSLLLAERYFPQLDIQKVLKIALLHDIGEIYAGDITPRDNISPDEKKRLEYTALEKVFHDSSHYTSLWKAYEEESLPEAVFVRQIDRIEMALQASIYEHQDLLEPLEFFESARSDLEDPILKDLLKEIIDLRPNQSE